MEYTEFSIGGSPSIGMMPKPKEMPAHIPSYWMPYFQVISVDASTSKAKELGGKAMVGPQDIPGTGRFAIVKPVDPDDPTVGDVIADWKQTPGAVGIRIMMTTEAKRDPNDPGLDRILRAAVRHDLPVNTPTRGSSSTISASCSCACRPRRRSPGPSCRRCWNSPSARTR